MDFKNRIKNPAFWTGIVGVVGAFCVGMAQLFGFDIAAEAGTWEAALAALITAVFGVLGLLGVAVDPTTPGLKDGKDR